MTMMELPRSNAKDFQQIAIMVLFVSAGKRAHDIHCMLSKHTKILPQTSLTPRGIRFGQDVSKTDPEGRGPEEGRQTVVLCSCLEMFDTNAEQTAFGKAVKSNPDFACPFACPFAILKDYVILTPDSFGAADNAEEAKQLATHLAAGLDKKDFKPCGEFKRLMRAKTGHKDPFAVKFMSTNLGKKFTSCIKLFISIKTCK